MARNSRVLPAPERSLDHEAFAVRHLEGEGRALANAQMFDAQQELMTSARAKASPAQPAGFISLRPSS